MLQGGRLTSFIICGKPDIFLLLPIALIRAAWWKRLRFHDEKLSVIAAVRAYRPAAI